jgi:kynurenine formamidase
MVGNTGTYIDCPFHRYEDGEDFNTITLNRFCDLETIVVDVQYKENGLGIGPQLLDGFHIKNKAVLFNTGWDTNWNTEEYYTKHPFLHESTAQRLVDEGALLVGIDSYNIDNTQEASRPVHTTLLGNNILIVEHLTGLQRLPTDRKMWFTATPPKISGTGSFPVRAFVKAER